MTITLCYRCGGPLMGDSLDLAPLWCLHCARRYDADLALLSRAPTILEESARNRFAYAKSERQFVMRQT